MLTPPGQNTFNIGTASNSLRGNPADSTAVDVIWGNGGTSDYNFLTGTYIILPVYIQNPTVATVTELQNYLTQFSQDSGGYTDIGDVAVIVNPSQNDHISINGVTVGDAAQFGPDPSIQPPSPLIYLPNNGIYYNPFEDPYFAGAMAPYNVLAVTNFDDTFYPPNSGTGLEILNFVNGDFNVTLTSDDSEPGGGYFVNPSFFSSNTQQHIDLGSGNGSTLSSAGGNDILDGGGGNVTYDIGANDGSVTVDNYDPANVGNEGTIAFDSSVTPGMVSVAGDNDEDLLLTIGSTGNVVTVVSALSNPNCAIASVTFTDGTVWTYGQLAQAAATGSPTNTSLYGDEYASVLNSMGYATYAQGISGDDTFIYGLGYGLLTINETDTGGTPDSTLAFGAGISPSDVTVTADASGDLILTLDASDQITIQNALNSANGTTYGVQQATFADGTVWTYAQMLAMADTGSPTNTSLYGDPGPNIFDSRGYAAYEQGDGGGDTFIYDPGYGLLTINEADSNGSTNTLAFGTGISPSGVTATTDASGDLILTLEASDQVTLQNALNSGGGTTYGVQQVTFVDGTVWDFGYATGSTLAAIGGSTVAYYPVDDTTINLITGTAVANRMSSGDTLVGINSVAVIGNSDTLTAGANSTVTVNGSDDITTEGIWSTVTIDGTGDQDAAATGTMVTINGSGNTENGGSFLTVTDDGTEDQTTTGSSSNLNVIGNSDTLTAGANSTVTVSGSDDITAEGIWSTVTIGGTGDQDAAGTGTRVTINGWDNIENGGSFLAVTDSGTEDQTTAGSSSNLHVVGNSDTLTTDANSTVTVGGSDDITTEGIWSTVTIDGTSDQDAAATGTRVTIKGSDNIENGGSFLTVTDNGTGDQTATGSSSNLNAIGNSDTLTAGANSTVTVSGSNDVTAEGIWSTVTIGGTSDQDAAGTGTRVTINGSDNIENGGSFLAVTDNGTEDQTTAGSSSNLNVIGVSDTLSAGPNSTVTVNGSDDVTAEGIWSTVTIGGTGDQDAAGTGTRVTINGSDNIENGGSFLTVTDNGTDDQTTAGSASNLTVVGNNDTANVGGNSAATVRGDNDTVTVLASGGNTNMTFLGAADVASVDGANAAITDNGSGLHINIGSAGGAISLSNLVSDPTAAIDLLGGVGGYATTEQVLNALASDGHGGTSLSLGSSGSIEFINLPSTALTATNFQIG